MYDSTMWNGTGVVLCVVLNFIKSVPVYEYERKIVTNFGKFGTFK